MLRGGEDLTDTAGLDDAPCVHDRDIVAQISHDRDVVRDQQQAEVQRLLQLAENSQHLVLDDDIQCGHRLVGDQHLRGQRQRHGNHDPLLHPAGQLVRVQARSARLQAHLGKQALGEVTRLLA